MLSGLTVERNALKDQVAAERATLEEARTLRSNEREQFLSECMDEKRSLATERAELGKTREALVAEEVKIRARLVELEGRIAKESSAHEAELRYCKEMKESLLAEGTKVRPPPPPPRRHGTAIYARHTNPGTRGRGE